MHENHLDPDYDFQFRHVHSAFTDIIHASIFGSPCGEDLRNEMNIGGASGTISPFVRTRWFTRLINGISSGNGTGCQ